MQTKLAEWIRHTRQLGIVVESWMLPVEGLRILNELYPGQQFDFSTSWRRRFFKRERFSYRSITSKNIMKRDMPNLLSIISMWHVANRVFQEEVLFMITDLSYIYVFF